MKPSITASGSFHNSYDEGDSMGEDSEDVMQDGLDYAARVESVLGKKVGFCVSGLPTPTTSQRHKKDVVPLPMVLGMESFTKSFSLSFQLSYYGYFASSTCMVSSAGASAQLEIYWRGEDSGIQGCELGEQAFLGFQTHRGSAGNSVPASR